MPLQTVGSARIANNSITTVKIVDYAITNTKIANASITIENISSSALANYNLDDISYLTDGITRVFPLTYNTANVSISSPWNLMVSVNGALQSASSNSIDSVWLSYFALPYKGYTLDSSGNIVFSLPPTPGVDVVLRVVPGIPASNAKIYPFSPLDIFLGY